MVKNFLFKDRDGQTPLPHELRKGLKIKHIQTIGELDEYEEQNIVEGLTWLQSYSGKCVDPQFWNRLHKKLFENVWKWAGEIRDHELHNPDFLRPYEIRPALKQLETDIHYWIENKSFSPDEISAHFHERIETVHPYANGNRRFGRILIEYFCETNGYRIPIWGKSLKDNPKKRRNTYISTLDSVRKSSDYNPLIHFMFS